MRMQAKANEPLHSPIRLRASLEPYGCEAVRQRSSATSGQLAWYVAKAGMRGHVQLHTFVGRRCSAPSRRAVQLSQGQPGSLQGSSRSCITSRWW